MIRRDEEFLERWHADRADYQRWGDFVASHLAAQLFEIVGSKKLSEFLRLPIVPRVKDDESLLQKAFYRKDKSYTDPYEQIEDKVGLRLVLLLSGDVRRAGGLVETASSVWTAVKARDHEEEIAAKPYEFDYQSLHYVVRSRPGNKYNGHVIPAGLPCEIQIRTLLQHAYSELTHDTIYKPSVSATPPMKRAAAKSMALIEATGDYFDQLDKLIAAELRPLAELQTFLLDRYLALVGEEPTGLETPLNQLILDHYGHLHGSPIEPMEPWLAAHAFIGGRIAERRQHRAAFRLPSILLAYYFADYEPYRSSRESPLPDSELELVYSDLGKSLNG